MLCHELLASVYTDVRPFCSVATCFELYVIDSASSHVLDPTMVDIARSLKNVLERKFKVFVYWKEIGAARE
jgi:hypothetical protein